jgi:hypothetical protein
MMMPVLLLNLGQLVQAGFNQGQSLIVSVLVDSPLHRGKLVIVLLVVVDILEELRVEFLLLLVEWFEYVDQVR